MSKSKTIGNPEPTLVEIITRDLNIAYDRFVSSSEISIRKNSMLLVLLHLSHLIRVIGKIPSAKEEALVVTKDVFQRLVLQIDCEQPFAHAFEKALKDVGVDIDINTAKKDTVDPTERLDTNSVLYLLTQLLALVNQASRFGVDIKVYKSDLISVLKNMISTHYRRQYVFEAEKRAEKMLVRQLHQYP